MTMTEYTVGQEEPMLKLARTTRTINTEIILDLCKTTINQLKFLQTLITTAIMPITTAHKLSQPLTQLGEAQILMFQ